MTTINMIYLGKVRFSLRGGGVGRGFGEGRVISNCFYKLGRVKPVLFATGGGSQFFLAWKKLVDSYLLTNTRTAGIET